VLKLNPEIWTRNGGEQFVVLSMRDYEKVQELIEDAGLSRILRQAVVTFRREATDGNSGS